MSHNSQPGSKKAHEVSVGVAIELIARLRDTVCYIKELIVENTAVLEGTSKTPSRYNLAIHQPKLQRSSYFVVSSDGAVISSADTTLYNPIFFDPLSGYVSKKIGQEVISPSTVTLSELFEKVNEHSETFLNDQIDLIVLVSQELIPIARDKLYLYARASDIDSPSVIINSVYAYVDTITELVDVSNNDLDAAFINLHGAVQLIVQAAHTLNQEYILEALEALSELSTQIGSYKSVFMTAAQRMADPQFQNEVSTWIDRYNDCLGFAVARINDHLLLRKSGQTEPQKMVSSMSNPWRSSYVGDNERVWEARMLESLAPSQIENTTLTNATEILQVDRMLESMRKRGISVANPLEAVKHIIGFEPSNVVTEVQFREKLLKSSQSFFGLKVNGQPFIRTPKDDNHLYALFDGKQFEFYAAYPVQQGEGRFRTLIFHPKSFSEESIQVTFDSTVLARDPEATVITGERKKVPKLAIDTKEAK